MNDLDVKINSLPSHFPLLQITLVHLDIKDVKKLINYITEEAKAEISADYGKISTSTTGIILRKIIELEQQGGDFFFGEKSFEIDDLLRIDENGKGYVNILRLTEPCKARIIKLPWNRRS